MPSALETLVKILKLEQESGYQNKAVIGGLQSFAANWTREAHTQAKKPEHHLLVDELSGLLNAYPDKTTPAERHEAIKYMIGRITGRIPPAEGSQQAAQSTIQSTIQSTTQPTIPSTTEPTQPPQPTNRTGESQETARPRRTDSRPSNRSADVADRIYRADREESRAENHIEPKPEPRFEKRPEKRREMPPIKQESKPEIIDDYGDYGDAPDTLDRPAIESEDRWIAQPITDEEMRKESAAPMPDESAALIDSVSSPDAIEPPSLDGEPILTFAYNARTEAPKMRPPRIRRLERDPKREMAFWRSLRDPVTNLHGVGPKNAEKLEKIGINTVEDLIFCFPRRYDDYSRLLPLNRLQPNIIVTVIGTVRHVTVVKGRRNVDVLMVTIDDGMGTLTASFFGQSYLRRTFEEGVQVVFSGKTEAFRGRVTMSNPEWEPLEREALHTRSIVPVYPLTKGLSAHTMRRLCHTAVEEWTEKLPDYMPDSVLDRMELAELGWSIRQIHFPQSWDALEHAKRRLAFDELILLQLGVLRNRREWQSQPGASFPITEEWVEGMFGGLPFPPTGAQRRAVEAIRKDVVSGVPMNRLLQGDVGAGKTAVAAVSMLMAVGSGYQAAIMAPTGILAEQHYRSISRLIRSMPGCELVNVRLLTGATPNAERAETLAGLADGSVHILIGTHALIQPDVQFAHLGFVVVDEQHRFGVEQRGALRQKGKGISPHMLIMTATPIPRTLALTRYADLDLTILDEMPPGRTPIGTRVLEHKEREAAYHFIRRHIENGRQAFIVYPLVEQSESENLSEVRSAVEEHERLQRDVFPDLKLGLLHGKMSPSEKDEVMATFSRNDTQILVCTSVVEVGIDVPNATVILIEGANRFGLAQLHQFRGRVGRGQYASVCLLIPDEPGENERLKAMEETTDGFKLAQKDYELRGAGDLLGTRQSGGVDLGAQMNPQLVEAAQIEARTIYEEDPTLVLAEHIALREVVRMRYGEERSAEVS